MLGRRAHAHSAPPFGGFKLPAQSVRVDANLVVRVSILEFEAQLRGAAIEQKFTKRSPPKPLRRVPAGAQCLASSTRELLSVVLRPRKSLFLPLPPPPPPPPLRLPSLRGFVRAWPQTGNSVSELALAKLVQILQPSKRLLFPQLFRIGPSAASQFVRVRSGQCMLVRLLL